MSKIDDFKSFVRNNPSLIKYVRSEEMSWQKFFELYDLYGEDTKIWNTYLDSSSSSEKKVSGDFINWLKGIDLDSIREGVDSIQRVIGVFQDFNSSKNVDNTYQPRPLYKHFDD